MIPLPNNDEMIRVSAEQRIDFAVHKENGGYFRVHRDGTYTELTKEEWDELFNGEKWNTDL